MYRGRNGCGEKGQHGYNHILRKLIWDLDREQDVTYRSMLDFPHWASPTKTKRILGRSMSAKLGVPGEGVGSGPGVDERCCGRDDSALLFKTLWDRWTGVMTRWQALETRRTMLRLVLASWLWRDSTVKVVWYFPALDPIFARFCR